MWKCARHWWRPVSCSRKTCGGWRPRRAFGRRLRWRFGERGLCWILSSVANHRDTEKSKIPNAFSSLCLCASVVKMMGMAQHITPAIQDYLKAIHGLGGADKMVKPVDIAARLGVRASSVTGMLKRLAEADLVRY